MTDFQPYIEAQPGELITAQAWNEVQVDVKKDIAAEISAAKDDIRHTGVDKSKDSDEFGGKTPEEWTDELDQRYAPKVHDHEGQSVWRRYIKQFTPDVNEALLPHKLGRFPLVDVYELLRVTTKGDTKFAACKILFFSGHADTDDLGLRVQVYRDRVLRGIPFEHMAAEVGLQYTDDSSIADVVDDFWNQFMLDPNDEIEHCQTGWIDDCCEKNRTVGELKKAGDWDDLFIGLNPRKCGVGADLNVAPANVDPVQVNRPVCRVDVAQANYDTLHIVADAVNWPTATSSEGGAAEPAPLDLMFLLRI
jgi:hypothetical protein